MCPAVTRKSFARYVTRYEYVRDANNASMSVHLEPRDDDEFDPSISHHLLILQQLETPILLEPHSIVWKLALFEPFLDYACSRYKESYPYLVSIDPRFGDTAPNFQFLSCSGAVTKDLLDIQIPAMNANQNAILLSTGAELSISV